MEVDMLSMISHAEPNKKDEFSDSNCSIYPTPASKRLRLERYKGIVPQQNGHWGAQIYADHHRIWLGTFKSEIDAAMAYDSATIKLRSGDSHRNFQWNNITIQEPTFQRYFTTDAVLNMIRDGSYPSKFADFLRSQQGEEEIGVNLSSMNGDGEFSCCLLFRKELTPSDVGKLNRLVIPKRYAVKHFPNVPDSFEDRGFDAVRVEEVQLEFYDRHMRLWKFRYCYWKSSQSFVFTRGWNQFVKEKGLKENDTIAFYMYESRAGRHFGQSFIVIDVAHKGTSMINTDMNLGRNSNLARVEGDKIELRDGEKIVGEIGSTPIKSSRKGFRLFGVELNC